jgi:hypothetical protein
MKYIRNYYRRVGGLAASDATKIDTGFLRGTIPARVCSNRQRPQEAQGSGSNAGPSRTHKSGANLSEEPSAPLHNTFGQVASLTLCSCVLFKKLRVPQLDKKFPALHRTQKFINVYTTARQTSLSCTRPNQSRPSHPISLGPLLILSPSITMYFKWPRSFRFPHLQSVWSFHLPHSCYKRSASHPPSYRRHWRVSFCGCRTAGLIGSPRHTSFAADTAHSALPSLYSTQQQFGACYMTLVVFTVRQLASLQLQ